MLAQKPMREKAAAFRNWRSMIPFAQALFGILQIDCLVEGFYHEFA
jgi:hypothetical protein